jgi:hypothetical protein
LAAVLKTIFEAPLPTARGREGLMEMEPDATEYAHRHRRPVLLADMPFVADPGLLRVDGEIPSTAAGGPSVPADT